MCFSSAGEFLAPSRGEWIAATPNATFATLAAPVLEVNLFI